jgi:trk system potassium uptake protein TrkH
LVAAVSNAVAWISRLHPAKVLVLGYGSYVLLGWLCLCLPFSQATSVGALDSLFTATSAVSTTGLMTVSTGNDYGILGQVVVLALIQLGGIGYMTLGSFVILSRRHRISAVRRDVARQAFTLPAGMSLLHFLRSVVLFTVGVEALGVLALYVLFDRAGVASPAWCALFHSISAFCTAGFSLFDTSLEAFRDDFWMNAVIALLSYAGALGFIVFADLSSVVSGRARATTLTTRVILWAVFWLSVAGTLTLFLTDPGLEGLPPDRRLLAAFFQSMTASTTVGFNTVPVSALSLSSITVLVALMVVGASPSGTGGGAKVTTLSVVIAVARSTLRGDDKVTFWRRPVPLSRTLAAVGAIGVYAALLFGATFVLTLVEEHRFEDLLFEATSALGTVGLSRGITAALTPLGKLTIIAAMFLGRIGPLTIATALFLRAGPVDAHGPDVPIEDIAV